MCALACNKCKIFFFLNWIYYQTFFHYKNYSPKFYRLLLLYVGRERVSNKSNMSHCEYQRTKSSRVGLIMIICDWNIYMVLLNINILKGQYLPSSWVKYSKKYSSRVKYTNIEVFLHSLDCLKLGNIIKSTE